MSMLKAFPDPGRLTVMALQRAFVRCTVISASRTRTTLSGRSSTAVAAEAGMGADVTESDLPAELTITADGAFIAALADRLVAGARSARPSLQVSWTRTCC